MTRAAEVLVVGAGIAGVSTAYHLAVRHGVGSVVIVDPRPPLTLTSDKSTECYRNWWPDAAMVHLMNHSIDLLEELSEETDFGLSQRGYLFVTSRAETLREMAARADRVRSFGAGAEILGREELLERHAFLTGESAGALYVPRAGWFRARDLGQWMLECSVERGARLIRAAVTGIEGLTVTLSDGGVIEAGQLVIAAGPMSPAVAGLAGIELPLFSELHLKVAFRDHRGVIPRDSPMTIWCDPQILDWSADERAELLSMGRDDLLGEMPVYCHFRPEGGSETPYVLALWEYHDQVLEPTWPLPEDPLYPEVVMRGLSTMVPGLSVYLDGLPESRVDGGYYTKTAENRPLIGPSGVEGVQLLVGLSGFGVMVAPGAGDLVARHLLGLDLPDHADAFSLARYRDPDYLAGLSAIESGQL